VSRSLRDVLHLVTIIRHDYNLGKAEALRSLFRYATQNPCAAMLVMDADGQHPPEFIPEFLITHKKYPRSLILGNRLQFSQKIPLLRRIGIFCADTLLSLITGKNISDSQCGMRLIPAELFPYLLADSTKGFVAESNTIIIAVKNGFSLRYVPIPAIYHQRQLSHYRTILDSLHIGFYLTKQVLKKCNLTAALAS